VRGPREEFLAGAGLAAQQDGRMATRNAAYLLQRILQRGTRADDANLACLALLAPRTGGGRFADQPLFQHPLLFHQPLAIALDHFEQADGLSDQVRHHGQEAYVFIGRVVGRALVPDLFDGQRTNDCVAVLDRYPDERHAPIGFDRPVETPTRK